jgi:hypothetical protein
MVATNHRKEAARGDDAMDIISKRSGPRREDERARRMIAENRGTIERLADQISNGAYSSQKAAKKAAPPQASGLIMSDLAAPRRSENPKPYVRISPNRRVVVVDETTSRQMHHLGDLRRIDGRMVFVLATAANGFFSPLDADLSGALASLDGLPLDAARTDTALAAEIGALLGY